MCKIYLDSFFIGSFKIETVSEVWQKKYDIQERFWVKPIWWITKTELAKTVHENVNISKIGQYQRVIMEYSKQLI